jgi:5'-nucleotidase
MRILITNDDGIHAPGLMVLERIARSLGDEVYTVAPETDQSGVAHSLSLNDPLRLREISPRHFAVKGTPTDCVIMGIRSVVGARPDLVLSGINRGQNVAEDVTYSGTIAGAMEGTLLGIPSIALSQAYGAATDRKNLFWNCAETHAPPIIKQLLAEGVPENVLININFPDCLPQEVAGLSVTVQGRRDTDLLKVEERRDGRGNPYFWLVFARGQFTAGRGTDLEALAQKRISLTPLRLDLTDEPSVTRYARVFA